MGRVGVQEGHVASSFFRLLQGEGLQSPNTIYFPSLLLGLPEERDPGAGAVFRGSQSG